ncbi:selenate reductase [Treponema phagedenis]|uniref:Putative selenate reductase, YgfK subunit n=1 Tax=Treponema phagedenis TaxID=162 RepID=A0A0B7GRA8_TREPH|nr:selenate reductase [Treponema phagedenis]NVP24785.1 selenate reductase [Treponema phagedenis]QKS93094.1 selenate reductase [Treponema phagedenis]QLC58971.1 selenate reductase [Treponema phagedenis]QSH98587.1 selenate reductase [Treponema phagedenis]CEM61144.1 putative selenate reductase, YgfK subunit [Treponema phagedenis]
MSDTMYGVGFKNILKHIFTEYEKKQTIYNVKGIFKKNNDKVLKIFGSDLESPLGVAAGPHTQLAHNIAADYVGGARFIELKTVQYLYGEELGIQRPCIRADDEAYNIEWSSEFRADIARDEYVRAWFVCKVLAKELDLGSPEGFIFNMSVGYNLEGIKHPLIDEFIETLKDARNTKVYKQCKEDLIELLPMFKKVDREFIESISPNICNSLTLSTMHGTPPEEIEKIVKYILTEKKLHTYIKCNPTLLGYEYVRKVLDEMGYDYIQFGRHQFDIDLQFDDAVVMIKNLQNLAKNLNLEFGVKLTNTFQVAINNRELPGSDMYMSGKALYPLSIATAAKLSKAFDGKLPISFSGGADKNNIKELFDAGIFPVTVCTVLLKPAGLDNLKQLADKLEEVEYKKNKITDTEKIEALRKDSLKNKNYIKSEKERKKYDLHKSFEGIKDDSYECRVLCKNCIRVCPNRANEELVLDDKKIIIHIDSVCNECGNCQFCCIEPARPYKDRITIFNTLDDFHNSENPGFYKKQGEFYYRLNGDEGVGELPKELKNIYSKIAEDMPYYIE